MKPSINDITTHEVGRKTEQAHWDAAWQSPVAPRLPSRLNVDVLNITGLLRAQVKPGDRYIEIGCAPGKLLAWVSSRLGAEAHGLDYSETGIRNCQALFSALQLDIGLHHGDFFNNSLPKGSFDVVGSFGFIEHFDDPREAVARHVDLLKPGGTALIGIPNYGAIYGRLQRRCDPENLALHNVDIMNRSALLALAPASQVTSVEAFAFGRASLWLVNLDRRMPRRVARALQLGVNLLALPQFFPWPAVAPMWVLKIRK
jgi:SAM-dependent methyltransferase